MDAKQHLEELGRGFMHSAILLAAGQAGIFEALGEAGLSALDLARRLGLDARATETVLLALASEGLLVCEGDTFRVAPEYAPYLMEESPQTQIHILNHQHNIMQRWVRLGEVLRTGQPAARTSAVGEEKQMQDFIRGMADISRVPTQRVAENLDLTPYRRLLDLGGGPGTAAIAFAQKNPQLHCVVFDLEGPLTIAREQIRQAGLEERVTTQAGDYFADEFGEGFDVVYISNIIHSMGPDQVAMIAAKCRRALTSGGAVVIKEFFLDEDRIHPQHAALFSVNMLVGTEAGKSYTAQETEAILRQAGFGDFALIEVDPVSRLLVGRLMG